MSEWTKQLWEIMNSLTSCASLILLISVGIVGVSFVCLLCWLSATFLSILTDTWPPPPYPLP